MGGLRLLFDPARTEINQLWAQTEKLTTTTRMLSNKKVSEGEGVSEGCVVLMEL